MAICLLAVIGVAIYLIGTAISSSRTHQGTGDHLRETGSVGILVACLYWLFH